MSEQRLKQVMKESRPQYATGAPVLLTASAMYLDQQNGGYIAQMKWVNLDKRTIKALMVELIPVNFFEETLPSVSYTYGELSAACGKEFGGKVAVPLNGSNLASFTAAVTAVSFADGTVWKNETRVALAPLPDAQPQPLKGALLAQYLRDLAQAGVHTTATNGVQQVADLWQCCCGSWQKVGIPCLACHATQKALTQANDETCLAEHLQGYEAEQESMKAEEKRKAEEARIAREKAAEEKRVRQEAMRKADEAVQAAAKRKKIIVAIVAGIAAAAVA